VTQIDFERLSFKVTLIRSFTILVATGSLCATIGWGASKAFTWKESLDTWRMSIDTRVGVLEVCSQKEAGLSDSIASFKMTQRERDLMQDYRIDKIKRK
jgi:hypothetical protein